MKVAGRVRLLWSLLGCLALSSAAQAAVTVSPTSLSYGNQVQGTASSIKTITLTNGQTKVLKITSITTNLSDYTQTSTCPISPSTLASNATCTISVTFTPSALGSRPATLSVNDDAGNSPQKVTLSGTGVAAVTATPTSLSFGNQVIAKKSASKTVTVKNNQTTSLTITSISTTLADYTTTTTCPLSPGTLAAGASCTVSVFFTPSVAGSRSGTLTVNDNAAVSPSVSLSGTGIQPAVVNPASLTFAAQALGTTSAAQSVTLTNNQSSGLTISSVTSNATDFGVTTTCPLSPSKLSAGASCTASVTFSPKQTGSRTGTLSFNDDAGNTPQTVSLSGTGNPATLVSIAVTPANPSVAAGLTQQFTATGTYTDSSTQNLTSSATWTSSATSVATIAAGGLATSKAAGTSTIKATSGTISGSTTLTVTAPTLVSIAVTPANPSVAAGLTQQFTATGTYTDSSTQNLTSSATWTSSATSVATIATGGLATSKASGTSTITATSGSISGSTTLTVTAPTLVSIAVTPASPSVAAGLTQQFTATGTYTDSSTQNLTSSVAWTSSATAVATIAAGGLATSKTSGTSTITATSGTISGSTTLSVTAPALVSIAVTPASPSVAAGLTQQFTATGTYTDSSTQNLTSSATWTSSATSVATIAEGGLATSKTSGASTITATSGTISGSTTLTVTAPTLVSIAVTPASPSVAAGLTQQFTATGTYTDSSTQNLTSSATWTSSDSNVATVGGSGLATTSHAGSTAVTATYGTVAGSATLIVSAPNLVSIAVAPASVSLALGTTQQYAATGTYTDGSTLDLTGTTAWTTSSAQVATIDGSALATSVALGSATVTATLGQVSGSAALTVTPAVITSIAVTPALPTIPNGTTQQFTATATFTDKSVQDVTQTVLWSSSNAGVADINAQGLATSHAAGSVTVTAASGSVTASTTLTVGAAALVSIAVSPANPSIAAGTHRLFSATGAYTDNSTQDLTASVTWASDAAATASITAAGDATGVAPGIANISAAQGSVIGQTFLTVTAAELISIAINPPQASLPKGTTQQFTATGAYTDGSTQDITTVGHWTSSDGDVATISDTAGSEGLASALATGTTTIGIVSGSISGSADLTVTAAALVSIAVTPANPSIVLGTTQQFTATGSYSDSTTQDITGVAVWSSSSTPVAIIGSAPGTAGLATSSGTGSTTITATVGSISSSTSLGVTDATLVSLAVTPSTASISAGSTQQFVATGTYSNGDVRDITTSVNWSSNAAGVAGVDAAGLATGLAAGATQITAASGTLSASATLNVANVVTLVSLSVAPSTVSVSAGASQQFSATATYSDGSAQDVTGSATWSSNAPSVASVSSSGLAIALAAGSATVSASLASITAGATLTVTAPQLVSLAISPTTATVGKGATQQFTATGTYSDGSTQTLTNSVAWSSSDSSIAVIDSAGLATGQGIGAATITATSGELSQSATLNVGAASLLSIAVTPANPSFAKGTMQQLVATGTYSDGSTLDLTGSVTWTVSNSAFASVDAQGLATGLAVGSTTATATSGAISGSTTVNVTAATVVSIVITPVMSSAPSGTRQQFTATGTFTDNSVQDITQSVEWSSDNDAVATISNAPGNQGLATIAGPGSVTITAAAGSATSSTTLTVTEAVLASVSIAPVNPSVPLGTTQQFTATATYTDGTTQDVTATATWSSDATAFATVNPAGLASTVAPGIANITAAVGAISGSTTMTVTGAALTSIQIAPSSVSVPLGATQQFTATGTYTDGTTQDITQSGHWTSTDASVATISDTDGSRGLASTLGVGTTTIGITSGSISATATLTVSSAQLLTLAVTPANATLQLSGSLQFVATGSYTNGSIQDLTASVAWSSSSPSVAVIGNDPGSPGSATSASAGTTTITATLGSISASTTLTVLQPVSLAVTPGTPGISIGFTQQFAATATFSDNSTLDVTSAAAWTSSVATVATVSSAGLAQTRVSPGTTTIAATWGTLSGSATLTALAGGQQYTHVYVVFPPDSGTNLTHFMNTVIGQSAIDGVTVKNTWSDIETGTPGPNTCSPVGTDICQQDAFGWTHAYNWTSTDAANATWFSAAGGNKKVNILLFGITGAGTTCLQSDACANNGTPYYVATQNWVTHTGAAAQDVINGVKDGCTSWIGKKIKTMTRDANGMVTVTRNNHGYQNGDIVWIGGTTPSNYNIAQTTPTNVQVIASTSTLIVTAANSYPAGMQVTFRSLSKATFLNGQVLTVTSSTPTTFNATFSHADYNKAETAGTVNPFGVPISNVTSNTFTYQSGTRTADSATSPGQVISAVQSWPVPYELPYKEAWKPFVAAALVHFANNPQVDYIRVGRSVGGEAFPYCTATLKTLPSPNTYSKTLWLNYDSEIDDFVQAQHPTMQIMDALNSAEGAPDNTYGTAEAGIAVAHQNSLGNANGFGAQGLRSSDITNYNSQPPQYCSSDWCGTFNTYYNTIYPLELQQIDLSSPNALYPASNSGDLRPLLPFAVSRHMTILELYNLDALLAYDPNYCILNTPDNGSCATGSISIPTTTLPPGYQYPYFQAVGQPGQPGAHGDGSYAATINATHGAH